MNALQGSLMRFQRCSATVKKSRCIIRKKTNLLQRNAETMTLSQGTDRLVFSKDQRERALLIVVSVFLLRNEWVFFCLICAK